MSFWKESDFSNYRADEYRGVGATIFNCTGSFWQGKGWPDWLVGSRHFFGWLELKVDDNPLSPSQKLKISRLLEEAVPVLVYTWENKKKEERLSLFYDDGQKELLYVSPPLLGNPVEKLKYMKLFWHKSIERLSSDHNLEFPKKYLR